MAPTAQASSALSGRAPNSTAAPNPSTDSPALIGARTSDRSDSRTTCGATGTASMAGASLSGCCPPNDSASGTRRPTLRADAFTLRVVERLGRHRAADPFAGNLDFHPLPYVGKRGRQVAVGNAP